MNGEHRYLPESFVRDLLGVSSGFDCGVRIFMPVGGEENLVLSDSQQETFIQWGVHLTAELDGIFEVHKWSITNEVAKGKEVITVFLRAFEANASLQFDSGRLFSKEQKAFLRALEPYEFSIGYQMSTDLSAMSFDTFHLISDVHELCSKRGIRLDSDELRSKSLTYDQVMNADTINTVFRPS